MGMKRALRKGREGAASAIAVGAAELAGGRETAVEAAEGLNRVLEELAGVRLLLAQTAAGAGEQRGAAEALAAALEKSSAAGEAAAERGRATAAAAAALLQSAQVLQREAQRLASPPETAATPAAPQLQPAGAAIACAE
jgi:hypothetical protein